MRTVRTAWLHIGGENTGTTTLQASLAANRAALLAHGVGYGQAAGGSNHYLLALHAARGQGVPDLRAAAGLTEARAFAAFLDSFPDRLRQEAEALGTQVLVYSAEHLSSRLRDREAVERAVALLRSFVAEVRVVYYARPQEELVLGSWSTELKSGWTAPLEVERYLTPCSFLDHEAVAGRWADVLGDAAVTLRVHQKGALAGDDVVTDFLAATGLPAAALPLRLPARNRSLDAETAEFLRMLNLSGARVPERLRLLEVLEAISAGPPLRLSAAEGMAVETRFAPGNAAIARRLLGRGRLFLPAEQPVGDRPALGAEAAVRIAAALWAGAAPQK